MKHAQGRAHWSGKPSLSQLWLGSTLHALAMLVLNVVSFLRMRPSRVPRECHTDVVPAALPRTNSNNNNRETTLAETSSETIEGLMVSSTQSVRPSNQEARLAGARNASCKEHAAHLPRAGEGKARRPSNGQKAGGGQPSRSTPAPVPHRTSHAAFNTPVSLPRSGEENRARLVP